MLAHATLPVADCERAKEFYTKALAPLGYRKNMDFGEAVGFNDGKNTDFWITERDTITPLHLAFEVKSQAEVEAFYNAALGAGARDNGGPGYRSEYWPGYYAAFVCDPDGNNVEAVWYDYDRVGR